MENVKREDGGSANLLHADMGVLPLSIILYKKMIEKG